MDFTIIILCILFFMIIPWLWVRSHKYWFFSFKDFKAEILEFTEKEGLILIDTRKIAETDYTGKTPFKTVDTKFWYNYLLNTLYNHQLVRTKTKTGQEKFFWFRASVELFKKEKLEFKPVDFDKGKLKKYSKINLGNNCPACNQLIEKEDKICPNCGLNFL